MAVAEQGLQDALLAVLLGEADPTEPLPTDTKTGDDETDERAGGEQEVWIDSAVSFEDDGVMTLNKGLVVRLSDGSRFQLTVVRSR